MGVANEGIPLCAVFFDIEVVVAISDGASAIPVPRVVPIGLGEIDTRFHIMSTESIENFTDDVATKTGFFAGRLKVREVCVVHGVTVMMFCRKNDVTHSSIGACTGPFLGVEVIPRKRASLVAVPRVVFLVAPLPVLGRISESTQMLTMQGPGAILADVREDPPVDDDTDLVVPPLLKCGDGAWIRWPDVSGIRVLTKRTRGF